MKRTLVLFVSAAVCFIAGLSVQAAHIPEEEPLSLQTLQTEDAGTAAASLKETADKTEKNEKKKSSGTAKAAGTTEKTKKTDAAPLSGDADGDGKVTLEDARKIMRIGLELDPVRKAQREIADYDNDGKITLDDARLALRTALGLDPAVHPGEYVAASEPKKVTKTEKKTKAEKEPAPVKDPVADIAGAISYDRLSADMKWLVNTVGVRSWWDTTQNSAAEKLVKRLQKKGFSAESVGMYPFKKDGVTGYNVMAVIPTAVKKPDIYVFSAHYDTTRDTGGAVDNSSGTAALLELARVLNAADTDFGAEVRFVFTAGEEQGYYGAYAYVQGLSASEKKRHMFFFNIDMAGRPASGKYYLAVSTEPGYSDAYHSPQAKANLGSRAVDAAYAALGVPSAAGYYSPVRAGYHDLIPFRRAGYPALTLSWRCIDNKRAVGADYGLATPADIHTKYDDLAHFHMDSLYQTTRIAAWAAADILYRAGGIIK